MIKYSEEDYQEFKALEWVLDKSKTYNIKWKGVHIWIAQRNSYCDRGHWCAGSVDGIASIDKCDAFPRYYMDLQIAKQEMRKWAIWRLFKKTDYADIIACNHKDFPKPARDSVADTVWGPCATVCSSALNWFAEIKRGRGVEDLEGFERELFYSVKGLADMMTTCGIQDASKLAKVNEVLQKLRELKGA